MKILFKSSCVAFILTAIFSLLPFQAACADISDEVFRLHIIANSDSAFDQSVKLKVRDTILAYTETLYRQAQSREEAECATAAHLQELADLAAAQLRESGPPCRVRAEIVRMYFGTRHYESYTLPAGMYDALRITLGNGEGHNWWCVMFPSLCINTDTEGDRKTREAFGETEYHIVKNEKQDYKFFVVELFERLVNSRKE